MTNPPNGTVPMATNKRPSYPTHGTPISSAAIHPMQPGMTRPIANSSTAEGRPLMTPSIPNTTGPTPGTMATGSTIPQQRQMSVHSQGSWLACYILHGHACLVDCHFIVTRAVMNG